MKRKFVILCFVVIIPLLFIYCAKPSEPSSLNRIMSIDHLAPTGGYACDVSVSDSLLFIAEDQNGFSIYNYLAHYQICHLDTLFEIVPVPFENIRKITAVDEKNLLFIYDRHSNPPSIRAFDITDRTNPDYLFPMTGETGNVDKIKSYAADEGAYFCWSNGKQLTYGSLDIVWHPIAVYIFPNSISGFDTNEDYFIVAAEQLGFHVVDKSSGEIKSTTDTPGEALDVKIVDNYVVIACREAGFAIYDISNKEAPELVIEKEVDELIYTVDVENDYLVLSSHAGGVYLYDISDISNPVFLDNMENDDIGYTFKAVLKNGKIFASTRQGVYIIDFD